MLVMRSIGQHCIISIACIGIGAIQETTKNKKKKKHKKNKKKTKRRRRSRNKKEHAAVQDGRTIKSQKEASSCSEYKRMEGAAFRRCRRTSP